MDRFGKFTDRARKVLTLAQDEAQRFNHNYIGTEHLLLGLVREGEGVAARVLENMNVELPKVRTAVEFIIGRGDRPVVGEVGLTPRAKRVIELAIDEARRLGHDYIGTEHLLLGLVREGQGVAAGVLESLGVNLDRVRHEVIRLLATEDLGGRRAPPSAGRPGFRDQSELPGLPPDQLRLAIQFVEVDDGHLERVIGLGHVATLGELAVELIALEIRATGCILHWKTSASGRRAPQAPELAVVDAAGTSYQVRPGSWSSSGRGARGELLIIPAPPAAASPLRLQLWPSTRERVTAEEAPWTVEVALPG